MKSKKTIFLALLLCISTLGYSFISPLEPEFSPHRQMTVTTFTQSQHEALEKWLGQELSWKEKLAFGILKRKLRRMMKKDPTLGKQGISRGLVLGDCFRITLNNGDVIEAEISGMSSTEVSYKPCEQPDQPERTLLKDDIAIIQTSAGDTIFWGALNPMDPPSSRISDTFINGLPNTGRKTNRLALTAGLLGIAGLLLFFAGPLAFFVEIGALVLGIVSLGKIKRDPDKYKGKGWAWTGIICGGLSVVLGIAAVIFVLILFSEF